MKTIKQIADELGVSKQAVQKRLSRDPLYTSVQPYVSTNKGTKYIDETGEKIIKQAFLQKGMTTTYIDISDNQQLTIHSDIVKVLQENITVLQKQLNIKDKQIEELTFTVRTQAESINADRKNELAGTLIDGQKLIAEPEQDAPEEVAEMTLKQGFLKRIFGKK